MTLRFEVALRAEAQPLLAFYARSVLAGARRVAQLGDEGGPSRARNRSRSLAPAAPPSQSSSRAAPPQPLAPPLGGAQEPPAAPPGGLAAAGLLLQGPEFGSVMQSLGRLRRGAAAPVAGIPRWLREQPTNGYAAAAGWFVFCAAGFFPCPLWLVPLYLWALLVGNALVAASQRSEDWARGVCGHHERSSGSSSACSSFHPHSAPFFSSHSWHPPHPAQHGSDAYHEIDASSISRCKLALREVEPLLLTSVAFWERLRNLLTFADGAASAACFASLGITSLALSAYLWLISCIDPELCFICGLYGAVAVVAYSRSSPSGFRAAEPLWWQWAFNEALACVPDDTQMVHRFVATRLQLMEV